MRRTSGNEARNEGRRNAATRKRKVDALDGRTYYAFVAQPLAAAVSAPGEESRELPGVGPPRLCPAYLLKDDGFRIKEALHKKSGSGARGGSLVLNKSPLLVVACNFCARPDKD